MTILCECKHDAKRVGIGMVDEMVGKVLDLGASVGFMYALHGYAQRSSIADLYGHSRPVDRGSCGLDPVPGVRRPEIRPGITELIEPPTVDGLAIAPDRKTAYVTVTSGHVIP